MYVLGNEVLSRIAFHEHLKLNDEGLYYRFNPSPEAASDGNFYLLTDDPAEICKIFDVDTSYLTASNLDSFKILQKSKFVINYHYRYINDNAGEYAKSFFAYMNAYPVDTDKPRIRMSIEMLEEILPYIQLKETVAQYEYVKEHLKSPSVFVKPLFLYLVNEKGFEKTRFNEALETYHKCFKTKWAAFHFMMTNPTNVVGDFIHQQIS